MMKEVLCWAGVVALFLLGWGCLFCASKVMSLALQSMNRNSHPRHKLAVLFVRQIDRWTASKIRDIPFKQHRNELRFVAVAAWICALAILVMLIKPWEYFGNKGKKDIHIPLAVHAHEAHNNNWW